MKRYFLLWAMIFSIFARPSHAAPVEPALWESYQKNSDAHPNLPNNSFAGAFYSEKPLPEMPVVVQAADFGALGDGKTDNTKAINDALEAAAKKGGGAVILGEGTFQISGVVWMHHNGVVLRGQGPGKTILSCSRPLEEAIGPNRRGEKSAWSWSGGFVWFAPRKLRGPNWKPPTHNEGWFGNSLLTPVAGAAKRGDWILNVQNGAALKPGMKVLLALRDSGDFSLWHNLSGDLEGTQTYDWATKARGVVNQQEWKWPVEIAAVAGNRVTLRQPLRTGIKAEWQPRILTLGPSVQNAGVENLTIQMAPAKLSAHLENPGWNGVYFENSWNCWAKNVTVRDCDNGFGTTASKCITLDGIAVAGRNCHHATFCRVSSHDTLWTRFQIAAKVHHGINVEGLSSGNVWSVGDMAHGTFDSHRGLPFENMRTDITVTNDGVPGGSGDAGPLFGARFAHWNVRILNKRPNMIFAPAMMPMGALAGVQGVTNQPKSNADFAGPSGAISQAENQPVRPPDLHAAQLALRLGRDPFWLGRSLQLRLRRGDGTRIALEWEEPFMRNRRYQIARRGDRTPWNEEFATVNGPTAGFEDTEIAPGERYFYRVRALTERGDGEWTPEMSMVNRPVALLGLAARETGEGIALSWLPGEETGGKILVQRREANDDNAPLQKVGEIGAQETAFLDASAPPGGRYVYRLQVENLSGQSPASEIRTFRRAAGLMTARETFSTGELRPLPARGEGESFGQWQWKGVNGDQRPVLRVDEGSPLDPAPLSKSAAPGQLAWPDVATGARSFVWTQDFKADLSPVGSSIRFDYNNGRSGISSHGLGVCLRLGDGSWVVSQPGNTEPLYAWHRRELVFDGVKWLDFDVENVTSGQQREKPDLSRITGLGFFLTRPINNRFIWFDNVVVWEKTCRWRSDVVTCAPTRNPVGAMPDGKSTVVKSISRNYNRSYAVGSGLQKTQQISLRLGILRAHGGHNASERAKQSRRTCNASVGRPAEGLPAGSFRGPAPLQRVDIETGRVTTMATIKNAEGVDWMASGPNEEQ